MDAPYPMRNLRPVDTGDECTNCILLQHLLPAGLGIAQSRQLDQLIYHNRPLKRHECLFRNGSEFDLLYSIRSGFLKSQIAKPGEAQRIVAFHMAGELIGMGGKTGTHFCDAIALQKSSVCKISYDELRKLSSTVPNLGRHLDQLIERWVVRSYGGALLLDKMHPSERLAFFLLNLAMRYAEFGGSRTAFKLEMPRKDLANFLDLTPATLRTAFADLEDDRIIEMQNMSVQIKDFARLQKIPRDYRPRRPK